jgi:hypothetical protein
MSNNRKVAVTRKLHNEKLIRTFYPVQRRLSNQDQWDGRDIQLACEIRPAHAQY